jgi:hypothetical protein
LSVCKNAINKKYLIFINLIIFVYIDQRYYKTITKILNVINIYLWLYYILLKMKFVLILLFSLLISTCVCGQQKEFEPSGETFAVIYTNFHRGISGNALDEAAFELDRGYLGYAYTFTPELYAKINLDVGSPDDLSPFSKIRRYAYFKNAYLRYSKKQLSVEFGLISLKQFKLQENIWGKRYLKKNLADEYRLGSSFAGGVIANSIFLNSRKGVLLEVTDTEHDSFSQWKNKNLEIKNNLFFNVAASDNGRIFRLTGFFNSEMANEWENYFYSADNTIENPGIDSENGDFVPKEKISGLMSEYPSSWFQKVDFKGAFGEDNWTEGWTLLSEEN